MTFRSVSPTMFFIDFTLITWTELHARDREHFRSCPCRIRTAREHRDHATGLSRYSIAVLPSFLVTIRRKNSLHPFRVTADQSVSNTGSIKKPLNFELDEI